MALHKTDSSSSDVCRPARGTLQRVRRTLNSSFGGRSYANTSPKPSPPLTPTSSVPIPSNHSLLGATDRAAKPTPFERFLTVVGKRKRGSYPDAPSARLPQTTEDGGPARVEPYADTDERPTRTSESVEPVLPLEETPETPQEEDSSIPGSVNTSETTFVARRIQALLSTLPISWLYSQPPPPSTSDPDPVLIPPSLASDSRLFSLMCSSSMMNGSVSSGRMSVWSVLDRLGTRGGESLPLDAGATDEERRRTAEEEFDRVFEDDNSSLMLCGPLMPTTESEVEVAQSEIISLDDDGERFDSIGEKNNDELQSRSSGVWSFFSDEKARERTVPVKRTTERKVWVPSTTNISLEVRWWGYRVYLPPPVLDILDNSRIEASKRAALLTTALTWLLDHVPAAAIPIQLRPALQLLKGLVPYLAYIGGFVAWTWGAIKGFDRGNGVILTATWLLPVALIPGTWEEYEVPKAGSSESELTHCSTDVCLVDIPYSP